MDKKIISFVVPIYNVGRYLNETIESLIRQERQDIEIILINDGSTDESGEICRKYSEMDSRIIYISQENQGVSVARNTGIRHAGGTWICFIDGDDWIEQDFCEKLEPYFDCDKDIVFYSYNINEKELKKSQALGDSSEIRYDTDDFCEMQKAIFKMQDFKHLNPAAIWGKLFRRTFLTENDLYFLVNQKKSQDTLFMLYALQNAKDGVYIDCALYNYRIVKESISRRYNAEIFDIYTNLLMQFHKFVADYRNSKEFWDIYQYRVFRNFMVATTLDFCHIDNHEKYAVRKKKFKEMMKREPFKTALEKVDIKQYPLKERILAFLIKNKMFLCVDMLNKMRYLLRKMG